MSRGALTRRHRDRTRIVEWTWSACPSLLGANRLAPRDGVCSRARRLIRDLQAGNVHINGTGPGPLSPASPFGGVKQSGYGRQGSRHGLAEFLDVKNVYFNI